METLPLGSQAQSDSVASAAGRGKGPNGDDRKATGDSFEVEVRGQRYVVQPVGDDGQRWERVPITETAYGGIAGGKL